MNNNDKLEFQNVNRHLQLCANKQSKHDNATTFPTCYSKTPLAMYEMQCLELTLVRAITGKPVLIKNW